MGLTGARNQANNRIGYWRNPQAMRRIVLLGCSLVILAGPFLCQAEAAEVFARSLSELIDRNVIEPVEPADDCYCLSGASLQAESGGGDVWAAPSASWLDRLTPALWTAGLGEEDCERLPGEAQWPPSPARLRQAFLQIFLF
jgi:hypothetical protein